MSIPSRYRPDPAPQEQVLCVVVRRCWSDGELLDLSRELEKAVNEKTGGKGVKVYTPWAYGRTVTFEL